MQYFIVLLIIIIALGLLHVQTKKRSPQIEVYLLFVCLFVFFLFRVCPVSRSIPDLTEYEESFNYYSTTGIKYFVDRLLYDRFEPGFIILMKLSSFFLNSFPFFLIVASIIILSSYFIVLKKYSNYFWYSVLLFILLPFGESLYVLRQHLAIACVFATVPFIVNRKLIPYILLMIVAFSFHKSSVIWLPMYFLCGIKTTKYFIMSLVVGGFLIAYICSNIMGLSLLLGDGFQYYENVYLLGNYSSASNLTSFFIQLTYLSTYLLVLGNRAFNAGLNRFLLATLIISVLISGLGTNIGLLYRLTIYYRVFILLAVPVILKNTKSDVMKILLGSAILLINIYMFIGSDKDFFHISFQYIDIALFIIMTITSIIIAKRISIIKYLK